MFTAPGEGTYYIATSGNGTHPSGTGTYELEVRDVRAPVFAESGYRFALSENAEGSVNRHSLGTVEATDPDGGTVRYRLVGGDESRRFAIDPDTGEVFYVGQGEDYESRVTSHELTVRASDGAYSTQVSVTVTVTDAPEAPAFAAESYAFELAENSDGRTERLSLGVVMATDPDGGSVHYSLVGGNASDLFAIEETSGELYYIGSGEDFESGVTSHELTVLASDGTHAIETTVTVTITDAAEGPAFGEVSYAFALAENTDGSDNRLLLGAVTATDPDPDGDAVRYRLAGDNESELFAIDATSGELFYVGAGEDFESGVTSHELTVLASDGTHAIETTVTVTVTDAPEAPAFGEVSYAFELAENSNGRTERLSLGVVTATDPEGDPVRYSLAGGNASDLFAIEETSGELYYVGSGEDFESGVTSYELTVGASDGAYSTEVTVTVTVTDVAEAEAPAFEEERYAFALPENTDGSDNRLALGAVTATDPDGDAVRYSLSGGNASDLFAIGETSGELYYVGGGEDDESGATTYELTVQASDGTHPVDTMVTVTVVDNPFDSEKSTGPQGSSEPASEDLPAGRETSGEVRVDAEPVDGTLRSPSDRDWFAVTLAPGRTYVFALEGDAPRGGTGAPAIRSLRDANGDPVAGIVGGTEVRFTTDAAAAEAVYYIEVGGEGGSGQGTSATRGVGARSLATRGIVDTLGSSDGGTEYRLRANDITETRDATDDYPSDTSTTGVVMVGGSVTGEIERSGDRDWFAVDLEAGRIYRIDLKGRSTGDGTLHNPYLRGVYDDNGVLIRGTWDDDRGAGRNSRADFVAPADATYYLAAGAYRDWKGTYTLSVTEVHDDFPAGTGTSGTVEIGGSATGGIEFRGDRDWFEVTLQAGKVYRFELKGGATGDGTLPYPHIRGIYDADGDRIDGTTGAYNNEGTNVTTYSRMDFAAPADDTYYVSAEAKFNGYWWRGGTYTLYVTEVADDYASGIGTTGTLAVGAPTTGAIDYADDRDWFAVPLDAGKSYRFDLEGSRSDAGTLFAPRLHGIFDSDGNEVDGAKVMHGWFWFYSQAVFTPDADDTYYVSAGQWANTQGTYTLTVTEIVDDYTSDTSTTGRVTVGGSTTGFADHAEDLDWFAVTLEADTTYRFNVNGDESSRGRGFLYEAQLRGVYDSNGDLIAGTESTGFRESLHFKADAPGTYYLSAGTPTPHYGTYTVSVTKIPDDFAAGIGTSGTVDVGGNATGEIDYPNDRDWFAVTLGAGKTYRIDLEGADTGAGTLHDPVLRGVHDATGVLLDGTTDGDGGVGRNSRLLFEAAEPGTYYVAAGAALLVDGTRILSTGGSTYTLSVEEVTDGM